jgi:nitrogen fixation NifU-like protein
LLTDDVKGKTKAQAQETFEKVRDMITTGEVKTDMGKLAVFAGVHKYPARVKCAILSWHALMGALKGDSQPVTTENEQT